MRIGSCRNLRTTAIGGTRWSQAEAAVAAASWTTSRRRIDDLRAAGEKATGDVRSNIDSAVSRLRDVSGEATKTAQDQVSSWRSTLEDATEDVRKELAKLAVRAQSSLDSLDEVAKELDERRKSLGGGKSGGGKSSGKGGGKKKS